jgi:MFS family permease
VGIGFGTFIAVDWALMTDIIPKQTTGRYMGISNVATAIAGPTSLVLGGIIIALVNSLVSFGAGPRAALALGAVLFILCAVLLRPVDPRRREDRDLPGPIEPSPAI